MSQKLYSQLMVKPCRINRSSLSMWQKFHPDLTSRITKKTVGECGTIFILDLKKLSLVLDFDSKTYRLVTNKGEVLEGISVEKVVENYIESVHFKSDKMSHLKRNYELVFMDVRNFNCAIEICERKTKIYLKKINARLKSLKKINRKV